MSQAFTLHVDNLKCGGCAHTIEKSLSAIPGVSAIVISPERGEVGRSRASTKSRKDAAFPGLS
jgi:copper chaperone CopZ